MCKGSPFYIQTHIGRLELTKGTYLTLQKRHNSALGTIPKNKTIAKRQAYHHSTPKVTVKRTLRSNLRPTLLHSQQIFLSQRGKKVSFPVYPESRELGAGLPSRELACDNDEMSEEGEIEGAVRCLSLSLSLAAFDQQAF